MLNLNIQFLVFAFVLIVLPASVQAYWQDEVPTPAESKIWKVEFSGNKTFKDVVLSDIVATRQPSLVWKLKFWSRNRYTLDETELRRDVIRIQRFYERRGFPDVSVSYRIDEKKAGWKKKIMFNITEGRAIIITERTYEIIAPETIRQQLEQNSDFQRLWRGGSYQAGNRYQRIREPDVKGRHINRLQNLGFAHAKVELDVRIDSTAYQASVHIRLIPGPPVMFSQFFIQGNERASDSYILKEADIRADESFSNKKIEDAQQELFNHHIFRFATISIPEQPEDSTLDLEFTIREEQPRSVRLRGGVSIEEIVRGEATWIHRNPFGQLHRFSASARASFISQRGNLNYQFPQVFNTKSSIIINPFGEHIVEPGFELINGGISNSFVYKASRTATTSISYEFTRNREQLERTIESLPDSVNSFNISTFQISGVYGKGVVNRQQGWLIQPSIEFSGLLGSASFNFQRLTTEIRRYFSLSRSTTLAARTQGGVIFNIENDSLPTTLRFFNGGTSRVRGFGRQQLGPKRPQLKDNGEFDEFVPVGGRVSFTFNAEIRQDFNALFNGFGVAFFLDGGQVWENVNNTLGRPLQYAAGGGIRYESPIGPIRLDVGYIINPNDDDLDIFQGKDFGDSLERVGFHLSIGQAF